MVAFFLFLIALVFNNVEAIPKEALLSEHIAGGNPAKSAQFSFLVSIRIKSIHYCAGSIINEKWILTAAYCKYDIPLHQYSIKAGMLRLNSPGDEYEVAEFITHPDYKSTHNDIALIKVATFVKFTPLIRPAKLPKVDIGDNEYLLACGWGYTTSPSTTPNDLMYIYLITYNRVNCALKYNNLISDGNICTYSKKGFGVCSGDSGGPMTSRDTIYGITTWVKPCVMDVLPFVFTRVRHYVDWIQQTASLV